MALTGPKTDTWLVKTFGLFIAAVGAAQVGSRHPEARDVSARVGIASAVSLAAADIWFVARRRIAPIYLADAAVELVLAALVVRRRR